MIAGMFVECPKRVVAQILIEAWCLEVEGVEDHVQTSTGWRFLLCSLEVLGLHSVSPQVLIDPERAARTTATPGPSFNLGTEALLVSADKDCQPLSVVHPSLRGII